MNQEYMKTRKILPLVLSMSLPMVISMAVNALYNIVDSYFVAKISDNAMTALALVFPVQNLVNAIAIGFAIGINARVAFYLGAKEEKLADESASAGLLLNFMHGLVLAVLCSAIMPSFLRMFTGDEQVIALACTYSMRVFAFAPVGTCLRKDLSGGRADESVDDLYDARLYHQYHFRSGYDFRARAGAETRHCGSCLCNRNRTVRDVSRIPVLLCAKTDAGKSQCRKYENDKTGD